MTATQTRLLPLLALAALGVGCRAAPQTRPRVLSVQTPRGMYAPRLDTKAEAPLLVPSAPVGTGPATGAAEFPSAPAPLPAAVPVVPAAPAALPPAGAPSASYIAQPCPTCNKGSGNVPPPFGGNP